MEKKFKIITDIALSTKDINAMSIAVEMMKNDRINIHGPEHHYLIVAALLSAYSNSVKDIDLEKMLNIAKERAGSVPGGICGMWGSCGAGIEIGNSEEMTCVFYSKNTVCKLSECLFYPAK